MILYNDTYDDIHEVDDDDDDDYAIYFDVVIIWFHVALYDIIDLNMIYMYVSECMKWHTYPHISYLSVRSLLTILSIHSIVILTLGW